MKTRNLLNAAALVMRQRETITDPRVDKEGGIFRC